MGFGGLRLGSVISQTISGFSHRKWDLLLGRTGTWYGYSTIRPVQRYKQPWEAPMIDLCRLIRQIRDEKQSAIPIVDQWIGQSPPIHQEDQLLFLIKELRYCKRYAHALEISVWMTDKRCFVLTSRDAAIRLDLISKVHGIEKVENYFNDIPQQLKGFEVYGALLKCYAYVRSVEKAEAVMQRMRELGFAKSSLAYTVMLNLYNETGNIEKLRDLIQEMGKSGIVYDKFAYSILLNGYAALSDIEGMEKTRIRMESDPKVVLDSALYAAVANGYVKVGLVDKALEMLKKSEGMITGERMNAAYKFLITQYATIGKKDEVLRLWEVYKKKVYNRDYASIMTSLLKFDDFENAEKIFEEWESKNSYYTMLIPNYLIGAYCKKGRLDKAEALLSRAISEGGKPNENTWYYLAKGYLEDDQTAMAVEAMEKAIVGCRLGRKPSNESLAACLDYLKGEGDLEKAKGFIKLLRDNNIICLDIQDRLLIHIEDGTSNLDALGILTGTSLVGK